MLDNLQKNNTAVNKSIDEAIAEIDARIATGNLPNDVMACNLWAKNELLDLATSNNLTKVKLTAKAKPIIKEVIVKKIIEVEDDKQNKPVKKEQIFIGPKEEEFVPTATKIIEREIQKTEQTIYYKPDSSAWIQQYTDLKKEIDKLRLDVQLYKELADRAAKTKTEKVVVKRPLFGRKEKNNDAAMEEAIAKLRKEMQPIIIRDTIMQDRIVEKPMMQYVDRIIEKPVIQYVDKVKEIEKVVEKPVIQYVDKVKEVEKTVTKVEQLLSLPPDVILFDIGKSLVKTQYKSRLDYYATQLKKFPELKVALAGFTDNSGNAAANLKLSQARATAVSNYLVSKGVGIQQITTSFDGANNPADSNNSATSKSQNRRVEISFNK